MNRSFIPAAIGLVLLWGGCGGEGGGHASYGKIDFQSYEEGMAQAEAEGKPVFIYFGNAG